MLYCVVRLGGCISDYQGCYAVLRCTFGGGGCISDYQGCYAALCCIFYTNTDQFLI